jgi:hypothetical protein
MSSTVFLNPPHLPNMPSQLMIEITRFGIPFTEHETFRFNTALFLLALAFADNALFGYSSPSDLGDQEIPEGDDELPLRWNKEVLERPILRAVTADGGVSDSTPLTRVRFCDILRAALQNAGFFGRITIHAIRRGLANKVDSTQFLLLLKPFPRYIRFADDFCRKSH